MWWLTRWFSKDWWAYLLADPACGTPMLGAIWCRLRNHPAGTWYYTQYGSEPDTTCKECGDDLG